MAALEVFKEVGKIADSDFLAMDVLPILWQFSLGPLLNLQQFQAFMTLIKSLSSRIEQEQTRKLQELSSSNTAAAARSNDFMTSAAIGGTNGTETTNGEEADFESLVRSGQPLSSPSANMVNDPWVAATASSSTTLPSRPSNPRTRSQNASPAPAFSWSTPPPSSPAPRSNPLATRPNASRTITPDNALSAFAPLTPSTTTTGMNATSASSYSQPLQPSRPGMGMSMSSMSVLSPTNNTQNQSSSFNWSAAVAPASSTSNVWAQPSMPPLQSQNHTQTSSPFAIAPPPKVPYSNYGITPPPSAPASGRPGMGMSGSFTGGGRSNFSTGQMQGQAQGQVQAQGQKQGLDKYESLL